jgi:hypothetical protein
MPIDFDAGVDGASGLLVELDALVTEFVTEVSRASEFLVAKGVSSVSIAKDAATSFEIAYEGRRPKANDLVSVFLVDDDPWIAICDGVLHHVDVDPVPGNEYGLDFGDKFTRSHARFGAVSCALGAEVFGEPWPAMLSGVVAHRSYFFLGGSEEGSVLWIATDEDNARTAQSKATANEWLAQQVGMLVTGAS